MSAVKVPAILVDAHPASGWKDGINPAVLKKLAAAARAIRRARGAVEAACQATDEGSDADIRCCDALEALESARYYIEWTPPAEH
jgi:hypothetical protein